MGVNFTTCVGRNWREQNVLCHWKDIFSKLQLVTKKKWFETVCLSNDLDPARLTLQQELKVPIGSKDRVKSVKAKKIEGHEFVVFALLQQQRGAKRQKLWQVQLAWDQTDRKRRSTRAILDTPRILLVCHPRVLSWFADEEPQPVFATKLKIYTFDHFKQLEQRECKRRKRLSPESDHEPRNDNDSGWCGHSSACHDAWQWGQTAKARHNTERHSQLRSTAAFYFDYTVIPVAAPTATSTQLLVTYLDTSRLQQQRKRWTRLPRRQRW